MISLSLKIPVGFTLQWFLLYSFIIQRQFIHDETASRNSWNEIYDYIVVGAGSAGCVVAARLSEDPSIKVLLLEAGGPQSIITDMPGMATRLFSTEYNWGYYTVPQERVGLAFKDRRILQHRGKLLGGSSSINGMVYIRGNRRDYDNWAYNYGATGWSFDEVLPYFLRSEDNKDSNVVRDNPGYHTVGGPLTVSSQENVDPIFIKLLDAANEFGLPTVDFNGKNQFGVGIVQQTINNGIRESTANAFLVPNRYRNNLHIITRAFVTKIIFNELQVTGVEFMRNGRNYYVSARKEIIVSAGAFNSPQILMLSGIGPREHLQQLNIPLISDLPVGNNLQDHFCSVNNFLVYPNFMTQNSNLNFENMYNYFFNHMGPLSQNPSAALFINSQHNNDSQWPDGEIQLFLVNGEHNLTQIVSKYDKNKKEWENYWRPFVGVNYLRFITCLQRPQSRGTIHLASNNPFDHPLIDPNSFSHPNDLEVIADLLKFTLRLTTTGSFPHYASLEPTPIPGCYLCEDKPIYECDEYVRCLAQSVSSTNSHPVGSCRMGSSSDSQTVVDERLRVKGVFGIRVIDASIMPEVPNSNINSATIMIGEYGAQMIKDDNQIKY